MMNLSEKRRNEVLQTVEQTIESSFGPLISYSNTHLTTVKRAKEAMDLIMEKVTGNSTKHFINIKRMLFYSQQIKEVRSIFDKICFQLGVFLGNNKCLLLSHGDVVATFNSMEGAESIIKSTNGNDLRNLISTIANSSNHEYQFWLRSKHGSIPYYVNAFKCNIVDNVSLVCLVEASENTLIRYLYLFSKQLDQIRNSEDLRRDLREIRKTVCDIQCLLASIQNDDNAYSTAFMKNPSRTSVFLCNVWKQIEAEVKRINGVEEPRQEKSRANSRFSFSSIRSAFSTFSLDSAMFSSVSKDGKSITKKLEVLLSHAKRQINAIIQELCAISIQKSRKITLPLFNQCISKIIKPAHIEKINNLGLGSELSESFDLYLHPANYFLEMLAYRIHFSETQQGLLYINQSVQKDLEEIVFLKSSRSFLCDITTKSGSRFSVHHIHVPQHLVQNSAKKLNDNLDSDIYMTVVYPQIINKALAAKQSDYFLKIVINELSKLS
ncbi:unnamed protein product [Caenorhabditis bovis]|uniref:Uncharacterized protein n=1 Tax=Caenorhabditis bovis TaxID=2654633 RepID=A0A8S1EG64_9PELO|nr:unnamed protein product [Caenorhabditis bovis]